MMPLRPQLLGSAQSIDSAVTLPGIGAQIVTLLHKLPLQLAVDDLCTFAAFRNKIDWFLYTQAILIIRRFVG